MSKIAVVTRFAGPEILTFTGITAGVAAAILGAKATLKVEPILQDLRFDEIVLDTRGEAEEVLDALGDLVHQYGVVTVTDLYKLVGIVVSFTDGRWGWNDLRSARVRMVMGGVYVLDLPKPIYLD